MLNIAVLELGSSDIGVFTVRELAKAASRAVVLEAAWLVLALSPLPSPLLFSPLLFVTESHVAWAGHEFLILLPQPPEYWDHRCAPPCLADVLKLIHEITRCRGRSIDHWHILK